MYELENDDKPKINLQLNTYKCAMLNDFGLYSVHAESAEIINWSILNPKLIMLNIVEKNCHQIELNYLQIKENVKLNSYLL